MVDALAPLKGDIKEPATKLRDCLHLIRVKAEGPMLWIRVTIKSNTCLAKRRAGLGHQPPLLWRRCARWEMLRSLLQLDLGCTAKGPCFCGGELQIPV